MINVFFNLKKLNWKKLNSILAMSIVNLLLFFIILSCNKSKEFTQKPELGSLQQGIRMSAAVGYCTSIAYSAFNGNSLPDNVSFIKEKSLIYIKIDKNHPLPFNNAIGDIIISGLWHEEGGSGVITILFGNFDPLGGNVKVYGVCLVPVMKSMLNETITAVLFKEDIIINSSDTSILNMSNISVDIYNNRMDRFNTQIPSDAYIAVKQNIWFVNIDRSKTTDNVYDDILTVNGGGQMVEVQSSTGGLLYHAMINTKIHYSNCSFNPIDGYALSQNVKAGGTIFIDLGNSLLSFRNTCDGKAHVDFSSGKYITYNGKYISLDL
jgi:hypothetical protein